MLNNNNDNDNNNMNFHCQSDHIFTCINIVYQLIREYEPKHN